MGGLAGGVAPAPHLRLIEVQNLHKTYGDTVAVNDVSFTVREGEIFGILGPNGAGKTTTVESISGLRAPDSAGSRARPRSRSATAPRCRSSSASSSRTASCPTDEGG